MGSTSHNTAALTDVGYRERTYTSKPSMGPMKIRTQDLAAAGFFHTMQGQEVKCCHCNLIVDCMVHSSPDQVINYHHQQRQDCPLAVQALQNPNLRTIDSALNKNSFSNGISVKNKSIATRPIPNGIVQSESPTASGSNVSTLYGASATVNSPSSNRSVVECKGFHTFDSLRYERERLATFIDWPVSWLNPESLAKEGFYYLRELDHCSCVFCRGVVGSWEPGDIPRREHGRHFPMCAFIRGQPVGNVPIEQGDLLAALPIDGPFYKKTECKKHSQQVRCPNWCKDGNSESSVSPGSDVIAALSTPKTASPEHPVDGLPLYAGPRRKEYLTKDSRIKSFRNWPVKVQQTKEALADAGFFYCGLSDHVRCFHCSNGLRNWEAEDEPWVEHARWYPQCNYVLLSKGTEYIDQVRQSNPPYFRTNASTMAKQSSPGPSNATQNAPSASASPSYSPYVTVTYTSDVQANYRVRVTDQQLDTLMELDIIQAVMEMGFSVKVVKKALRQKIEETGVPFFTLDACTERVLICNESGSSDEAEHEQEAKMSSYQREREERIRQSHEESLTNGGGARSSLSIDESSSTTDLSPPPSSATSRTPIITSPVMPARRGHHRSNSTTETARQERLGLSSNNDNMLTEEMLSYRPPTDTELNEQFRENLTRPNLTDSEDIIEYPLIPGSERTSLESPSGDRDVTPTNDMSTPIITSPADRNFTNSQSLAMFDSPTRNNTEEQQQQIASTSPSRLTSQMSTSSTASTADPVSMEMMNQVDEIIEKQKRACRNLSNCSNKSTGSSYNNNNSSSNSAGGASLEDEVGDSSDEGNISISDGEIETIEEQLQQAKNEVASLKTQLERVRESRVCKICMDAEMSVVFLPCTHMATCTSCTLSIDACPICRTRIVHVIKPNIVA